MRIPILQKSYLIVSGMIAILIGAIIVSDPVGAWLANGINLAESVSLLNDVQATSATLLVMGTLILAGAFISSLTLTATVISAALYGGYALGRSLSLVTYGLPADGLVVALGVEVLIAVFGLFVLWTVRDSTRNELVV